MLSQSLGTPTLLARLFINPEFCQCPLRRSCQFQLFWCFDTYSKLRASAASACNWAGYCTFNIMVLKCMHYITHITWNVSQTGCTVPSLVSNHVRWFGELALYPLSQAVWHSRYRRKTNLGARLARRWPSVILVC